MPSADVSWNSHKITSLADPTVNQDAATKKYVDDNIPGGTSYWSCPGTNFIPDEYSGDVFYSNFATVTVGADATMMMAPVFLPHGAVVTAVVVHGSPTDETWTLRRSRVDGAAGGATMASANIDTQDTSIANATIDNNTYVYNFYTSTLDTNDDIDGARITYTL